MSDKKIKRSSLLDFASRLLDGITGGKKADVAEGVGRKTGTLYGTYGSKGDKNEQKDGAKSQDHKSGKISSDDSWFAYTEEGRRQRGNR